MATKKHKAALDRFCKLFTDEDLYDIGTAVRGPDINPGTKISDTLKFVFAARLRCLLGIEVGAMVRQKKIIFRLDIERLLQMTKLERREYRHYLNHQYSAFSAYARLTDDEEAKFLAELAARVQDEAELRYLLTKAPKSIVEKETPHATPRRKNRKAKVL